MVIIKCRSALLLFLNSLQEMCPQGRVYFSALHMPLLGFLLILTVEVTYAPGCLCPPVSILDLRFGDHAYPHFFDFMRKWWERRKKIKLSR